MKNNRYAVVDLETTGTSLQDDNRIIQIGCAFIENDQVVDTFQSKVNPEIPIPTAITRLTGIIDDDVKNAPKFSDIANQIYEKLIGTKFVAHNVAFDFPFLNQELVRSGYPELTIPAIDTVSLSQILFYEANGYRLKDLTKLLGITHDNPHSADSDAVATAYLFLNIEKKLSDLPIVTLEKLSKLAIDLPMNTLDVITSVLQKVKNNPQSLDPNLMVFNGLALKKTTEDNIEKTDKKIKYPTAKKDKVKLYKNILSWRKPQASLMNYIHQQFSGNESRQNVVIEAPTGMGKTLGYLLPLSYLVKETQQKILISVPTTILQDQVYKVAKRQLNQVLSEKVSLAILKGSSHYLNLSEFFKKLSDDNLGKESRMILMKILTWLVETNTGDLDELGNTFDLNNNLDLLKHRGDSVLNEKDIFYDLDFYKRAQDQVPQADVIITNHHYLAQHSERLGSLLNKPYLVIDEAQHFVRDLSDSNEKFIDLNDFMMEAHRLVSRLVMNDGDNLQNAIGNQPLAIYHIRRFVDNLEKINELIAAIQQKLFEDYVISYQEKLAINQPAEIMLDSIYVKSFSRHYFKMMMELLANVFIESDAIQQFLDEHDQSNLTKIKWEQISNLSKNLTKFFDALKNVVELDNDDENVYWITLGPNHDVGSIRIGRGILNTGDFYQTKVEPFYDKILLIGGTLFVGNNRNYFLEQFNLSKENALIRSFNSGLSFENQLDFEILDSDFSLEANTNNSEYEKYLAHSIIELTKNVNRQTLILFNSLETIKSVFYLINHNEQLADRKILAQGIHGTRRKLIREFNDENNAILLGATSFWEGIDFPGDRLEYLIITRLPFRSPDDKIVQFISKKRRDVFKKFVLPDALLTFRQGLGRVIRKSSDAGVVVMLDKRIINRRYGKQFIGQLPNGVVPKIGLMKSVKKRVNTFFKDK